jgi:hypothetical protein
VDDALGGESTEGSLGQEVVTITTDYSLPKNIGHFQLFPTKRAFVISLDNEKSFFVFCSYRLLAHFL